MTTECTCKRMQHCPNIGGISLVQWRKIWMKLNTSNVFLSLLLCYNWNKSALVVNC